jgi:hypothetical protein
MPRAARPLLFVLPLLAAGCGKDDFQKVYPVKGKVTVDGQPAADCHVYLHRTFDDPHPRKVIPYGLTDATGAFQITSYVTGDGAPEGEYVVGIEWRTRSGLLGNNYEGPDLLDGAFGDKVANKARPGFIVQVGRGPVEIPPFDLKLTPEGKKKFDERKKKAAARPQLGGDR